MLQRMAAALAGLCFFVQAAQGAEPRLLAGIFADHAVLQRDRPIAVWGRAGANEEVTVSLANETRSARADAGGHWSVSLPAFAAGGPYTLSARTATRREDATDILVGDVWLCSGQSNMEWTVRNANNADWEADHSANAAIRHVLVPREARVAPRADFDAPLTWNVAGPRTTRDFSAVCYYMVRELEKASKVPQGMVHASWGGTRIETWLSAGALRSLGGNDELLDLLQAYAKDRTQGAVKWGARLERWWQGEAATRGGKPWMGEGEWREAPAALGDWENWGDPAFAEYDGIMWYRARVTLTPAQAKQAATLSLGPINDVDLVWINGKPMATGFGEPPREYPVPAKLLKAGENLVVINVFDMWGGGGLSGPAERHALKFADGSSATLAGWQVQPKPPGLGGMPRAPWEPIAGINILHNGMIAPLGKYGLRGVAWYQGEANGGWHDAQRYEKQLAGLFADWRRQFDAPLSFFVVQLANWGALAKTPVDSGWARLRDAQRRAVAADGNAGLAVTIDIGDTIDIHPRNKQDVGKRLAREARRVVYGEKVWGSAQPVAAKRGAGGVTVTLGANDGKLLVIGGRDPSGFELCGAAQETCRFVRATLRGDEVLLEDANAAGATRVRYCWADSPLCNLFDDTGLPVTPFEQAIQP